MIFYSSHQLRRLGIRKRTRTHTDTQKKIWLVRDQIVFLVNLKKKIQFWLCVDFVSGDSSDNSGSFISGPPSCTAAGLPNGVCMKEASKDGSHFYRQAFCG